LCRLYAGQTPWPDWISARFASFCTQVYTLANGTAAVDSVSGLRKSDGSVESAGLEFQPVQSITEIEEGTSSVNEERAATSYAELADIDLEVGADNSHPT
jgi:hypothetical protein